MRTAAWGVLGAACVAFIIAAITASGGAAATLWAGAGLTGVASAVLGILSLGTWQRERGRALEFVTEKWIVCCRRRGWIELPATVDKFASEFEASGCSLRVGDETIPLTPDETAFPHMRIGNRFVITFRADILPSKELPEALVDICIKLRNGVKKHVRATVPITWTD